MTADLLSYPDRDVLLAEPRFAVLRGKSALVTGGMGFIPSNAVHALVALGCSVTVVDSLAEGQGGNRFNLCGVEDAVDVRIADIRDADAMADAVRGRDYVFNLAGVLSHLGSLEAPFHDLETNARGTLTVLEAVRQHAPSASVVYSGTRSEYGLIRSNPVSEDHPLIPTEVNSANKAVAGLYHVAYHHAHGLRTSWLRLPNVYGPRMLTAHHRQGVINWFTRLAVEGGTIRLFGDGQQLRDVLYVDDVVHALLLAAVTPAADGEAINVGSGEPVSLETVARRLIDVAGRGSIDYVPFPEDAKRIEIGDYVADISKIKRLLGWQPRVGLRQGLERSVRYYQTYREHYW